MTPLAKKRLRKISSHFFVHLTLGLFSLAFLAPFLWMLSLSLMTTAETMTVTNFLTALIPRSWNWGNFVDVTRAIPFFRQLLNSFIVTSLNVVGTIISATIVAYAFAKLRWPGRKFFFMVLLITMMMPGHVLMVPTYLMYMNLNFINTYIPLILPAFLGGGAFNVFLFVQFYRSISKELSEAARIDGATHFGIWWKIILPLCMPAVATVAIFSFMFSWNDFLTPLLYILTAPELHTLPIGLRSFQQARGTDWNLLMAGSLMATIPILIIFFAAQKYFVEGIKLSGIKG